MIEPSTSVTETSTTGNPSGPRASVARASFYGRKMCLGTDPPCTRSAKAKPRRVRAGDLDDDVAKLAMAA